MGFERDGPGLLLRDIAGGGDAQVRAAVQVLATLGADVLLLTGFDHDHGLAALDAFRAELARAGLSYPYRFALNPNTGVPTGLDIDGNGRLAEARDAQGWGRFPGAGGMAILSRLPVLDGQARDFSTFLWADLPAALLPPDMTPQDRASQRLSTTAHWDVPLLLPSGEALHLLAWHATPPVFDGPQDRNGRRNHDEAAFWLAYLDGHLPAAPPDRFVLLGDANLDPVRGDGRPAALLSLLAHRGLTDPLGAQPTVDYGPPLGALRLDYLLPSARLAVTASGILRPDTADPATAAALAAASRHWPIWIDLSG
ncbi:endonuclease/exonuclease/phosphatase family protein [Gemmobacter straminiformis]|uniref:Endonuclease/exonuclease/phosphatase family protein n=1 Tax=Paragemmobacter straminiformis TaxID=2045119 RepID=A0A842I587_9RHOB|nr:endonuclease/exonuclease/phosphatase family protein [Gemmobacter straminiformis]